MTILKKIALMDMYVEDRGIRRAVFTYKSRQYDGFAVIHGLFRNYIINIFYNENWEICAQVDVKPKFRCNN